MNKKHGCFGTRLYQIWASMKNRCQSKKSAAYPSYGGRGQILVDLYPLSGVHSYEVIEYIDGLNAFFSCAGDTKEPVDFSTVLCWKPIYPPAPRKA